MPIRNLWIALGAGWLLVVLAALLRQPLLVAVAATASTALLLTLGLMQVRRAFAREQRKITTLLQAVPEGILEVNQQGLIVFVNQQLCDLFGYTPDELLGQSIEVLVPPAARGTHAARRKAFWADSRSRAMGTGMDITGACKDGSEIAIDISLSRLETRQGTVMYCLIRDNRTRKAFEQQLLEKNRQLTDGVARLERSSLELQTLTEMGELLHSSNTDQELFEIVAHTIGRLFPRLSGALYTLTDSRSTASIACSWGKDAAMLASGVTSHDCWALRRSRPLNCALVTDQPRCSHYKDGAIRPGQCIPLLGHGELLGVLHLFASDFSESHELATPARVQFVHALANQVALSTGNLRLREKLLLQSIVDPLTGVHNRRFLDNQFEGKVHHATAERRNLSLLALDIDHFKSFNDRFGHECGDIALRELGALLRRSLRHDDLICRMGGEEFAVLLPDTSLHEARLVAEKLCQSVETLRLERNARWLGKMTISVGIATLGVHGDNASKLLRHADRALYRAKAEGRNRVSVCDPGDDTGMLPTLTLTSRHA